MLLFGKLLYGKLFFAAFERIFETVKRLNSKWPRWSSAFQNWVRKPQSGSAVHNETCYLLDPFTSRLLVRNKINTNMPHLNYWNCHNWGLLFATATTLQML